MKDLEEKVVLITGGTQGIGLATAKLLSKKGAKIIILARTESDLHKVHEQIPNSLTLSVDVRDIQAIKNAVKKAKEHFGRIDILINNAGQGLNASIETIDIEQYRKIIDLNIIGALVLMQEVVPHMKSQGGGAIINISSVASKEAIPFMGAYSSTKYALNSLSLTAREELEKDNIIVSLVHPDVTATNFGVNLMSNDQARIEIAKFFETLPPADSPELVAEKIIEVIENGQAEIFVRSE